MTKTANKFILCALLVISLILWVSPSSLWPEDGLRIKYDYEYGKGKFGVYDIADTAKAYIGIALLGEARALKLSDSITRKLEDRLKGEIGEGRYLIVEEIQYDKNDTRRIIYKGQLIIDTHRNIAVGEIAAFGKKQYRLFNEWAVGRFR